MNNIYWNTLYGKYNEITMVDAYTDTVFFSDLLPKKCPTLYQSLDTILTDNSIDHRLLTNTRDIWCRDYMPIQTGEKRFVFYKYNPDYLQTKYYQRTITDVKGIGSIDSLRLADAMDLDLVVDGGNVVRCGNKIVMTEKVFFENKDKAHKEVQRLLEEAFQCDIVFLPWDRNEIMGHSDGIIHYLGDNRVMMTNYADFDIAMARKFTRLLEKHFDVIPLSYNTKRKHKHSWAYINFLQVGRMVLVPQLGIPEDGQALQQISEAMPRCKVIGVPAMEAVRNGGALNCISWNVATRQWNNGFMGEEYRVHGRPISWIKKAAEEGRANWQCNLGVCYFYGEGVEKNLSEASKWYKKAAEQGNAKAQFNLGLGYFKGEGVPLDYGEAMHWFGKASEQGDADAQLHVAWCLEDMQAPQNDVFVACKRAAEMGNADAQCHLGFWYSEGKHGLEKNVAESSRWFMEAANRGNDVAQFQMGLRYETGAGVKKNAKEAAKWYMRAASKNNVVALYRLGCCYYYGDGVTIDNHSAWRCFKKAAELGDSWACFMLGKCYFYGHGVEVNEAEAVKCYQKAAAEHFAPAVYELGKCYFDGAGTEKDTTKALELFREAAEMEYSKALYMMGYCYYNGIIVMKDEDQALDYFKKAAQFGYKEAEERVHDILLSRETQNYDDVPF
jgi:TPR repeat protein